MSDGFADPVSALIDAERRDQFEGGDITQPNLTSTYYLTLQWLPPADGSARARSCLFVGGIDGAMAAANHLADFERETSRVLDMIEGLMPEAALLPADDTLTYLHSTISTHDQRIVLPTTPMHLDALLADETLFGGLTPQLGSRHLRTLTLTGFPAVTVPGMLDELNRLGFAYRWTTRAICLDKVAAQKMLTRIRRMWFAKRKSLAAIVKEVMTNERACWSTATRPTNRRKRIRRCRNLGRILPGSPMSQRRSRYSAILRVTLICGSARSRRSFAAATSPVSPRP